MTDPRDTPDINDPEVPAEPVANPDADDGTDIHEETQP